MKWTKFEKNMLDYLLDIAVDALCSCCGDMPDKLFKDVPQMAIDQFAKKFYEAQQEEPDDIKCEPDCVLLTYFRERLGEEL